MTRGWSQTGWVVAGLAALGPMAVPGASLALRGAIGLVTATVVVTVMTSTRRRMLRDLQRIEHAVAEVAETLDERVVLPMAFAELAELAESVEHAQGRVRLQMRLLEQQREDLAAHLSRTEDRLRDPQAEARRVRIARIGDLRVELAVAGHSAPAALLDLSMEGGVLGVKSEHAERLVPGFPVTLSLELDGQRTELGPAVVVAPARGTLLDLTEWVFRFDPVLQPERLPSALAQALELRGAERIRPLASNPAHATLVAESGRFAADVVDISATGIGLRCALDGKQVARMGNTFTVQVHFPAMGEVAVLPVALRNLAIRSDGVRMGLSFLEDASEDELKKVSGWLAATKQALAA